MLMGGRGGLDLDPNGSPWDDAQNALCRSQDWMLAKRYLVSLGSYSTAASSVAHDPRRKPARRRLEKLLIQTYRADGTD